MKRVSLLLGFLLIVSNLIYAQYSETFFSANPNYKEELEKSGVKVFSIPATIPYKPMGIVNWSEGFEGTTFPPTGWAVHQLDGGTNTWIRYTTTPIFGTASAAVRWESATLRNDDWLVTPQFTVNPGAFLNFYAKRQSTTYFDSVEIYYSTTGGVPPSGYTYITTVMPTVTTGGELFQISLNALAGQNVFIAFRYKELDEWRFYLDSVYVETPVAIDAGVASILKPKLIETTLGTTPAIIVKNYGINPTGTFQAHLRIEPGGYYYVENVSSLASGEQDTIDFPIWTPSTKGNYNVTAFTTLSGDLNPQNDTLKRTTVVTDELPRDFIRNITALYPGALAFYGVEFANDYFYATKWNENKIFRINKEGTSIDSFTISGLSATSGIRDLAWDGQYLYGSTATTTVYRIDINTWTATTVFTSPVAVRGIAYDKANDAFWVANWSTNIVLVNRSGVTLQTIPSTSHGLTGIAGLGYDTLTTGGPYIWVFNGGTVGGDIWLFKLNAATGAKVDSYYITHHMPTGALGGGMFVTDQAFSGSITLGVLNQGTPHLITGYRIGTTAVQQSISVLYPVGGENFLTNSRQIILWKSVNVTGNVDILVVAPDSSVIGTIATNVANLGYYAVNTPSNPIANVAIKVVSVDNPSVFGISGFFNVVSGTVPSVDFPMVITDGVFAEGLRAGLDPIATDGIDTLLGEFELPPIPPSTVFDARFIGSDIGLPQLGNGTLKDYRQGDVNFSGQKIHELKYQLSDLARKNASTITIYWDLPSNVSGRLQDLVDGTQIDIPMTGVGFYTVTNPNLYDKLKVTYTYAPPVTGTIKVLYPNGGELLRRGSNVLIAWKSTIPGNVRLFASTDGGSTWILIEDNLPNTGVFGSTIGMDTPETNQWRIKIESVTNPSIFDISDANFTIQGTKLVFMDNPFVISDGNNSVGLYYGIDPTATDGLDPTLGEAELPPPPPTGVFDGRFIGTDIGIPQLGQGTLKDYRQGGASFSGNKIHEIQYQMSSEGDSLRLFWYLPDNVTGVLQDLITGTIVNVPMSGAGRFNVPNPSVLNKLKITLTYTGVQKSITVVQPNGGENWTVGSTQQIIWTVQNVQNVKLEYTTNNGATWILIADNVPAVSKKVIDPNAEQLESGIESTLGTYSWVIPNTPSGQCKVRVTDVSDVTVFDMSDNTFTISTLPAGPQLQFNYDISALYPLLYSAYGSEFDGQYFYLTKWNEPRIFRINKQGTVIDSFTVTGLPSGGFRDLAFDGQYLYGSNNTTTVYRIDRTTFAATAAFTSPVAVRAIAYNSAQDAFWVSNWNTNIVLVSRTGSTLYTITTTQHGLTGMAGNAYDTLSSGAPYLWVFHGGTGTDPKILYKLNPTNGAKLDSIDVTSILPAGAIGGGLWVTNQFETGIVTLGGSNQGVPHRIFGYRIHPVGPPTPTVTVVSPNGGEDWTVGSTQNIVWNVTGGITQVNLQYTTNNGVSWIDIATVPAVTSNKVKLDGFNPKDPRSTIEGTLGIYSWVIPNTPSTQCKVKVTDASNPSVYDESDNTFTISQPSAIGETWTVQNSGTTAALYSVSTVDSLVAWATGVGGVVIRTTNGGANWSVVTAPRAVDAHVICGISATKALVATNGTTDAKIHLTTNGGVTWTDVFTQAGGFINVIIMFDENNGFAQGDPVGGNWTLLKTTNGGLTWAPAATLPQAGTEYGWNNSGWRVGNNLWFGTNNSRVYRSTDLGATWSFSATTVVNSYSITFASDLDGLLGSTAGTANRSTNGGVSWSAITTPATTDILGMTTVGGSEFWFTAGTSVFYSSNHGTNWITSYTAPNTLYHLNFKPLSGQNAVGYAVGVNGVVVKYFRGPITPSITVVSPNGGENWTIGSTRQIVWTSQAVQNVKLEYTTNNGASWITIAESVPASAKIKLNEYSESISVTIEGEMGTYNWVIPNTPSNQCRVRISDVTNPAVFDISDNVFTISTGVPGPQLQFNYNISQLYPLLYSAYGSEFDGQYFYLTKWNEPRIFRINKQGTVIDSFTVTGLPSGGFRDLAFDGQYLYGSNNTTTVYRIDRTTFVATAAFTSPVAVRAISFNADRNAFWVSNWSTDIVLVSRTGTTLQTITTTQHGFTGMAGNAYDTLSLGAPYLWVFSGGTATDPKVFYKINPVNGQRIDSINVTDLLPTGAIGGGMFVTDKFEENTVTVGGSNQAVPHLIFGYKIHTIGPIPGTVTVLSPNGGEKYPRGTWQLITWKSYDFDNRVKIKVSPDGGNTWFLLASNVLNNGIYATQVPNDAELGNNYKIRIESQTDSTKFDDSDGAFEILPALTVAPQVNLPMVISDNEKSRLLRFGLDTSATDGIDSHLGEEELPPPPPAGILDGRFIGDDIGLPQLGQGLAYDFRRGRLNVPSIKEHELKFQRGTGSLIVINIYLPADVTARFQSLTPGFDTTVSGVARVVVIDTLLNKLKMTVNYFPSAVLGNFDLFGPINNATVIAREGDSTVVTFRWFRARNAVKYIVRSGVPTIPPFMLESLSNNNGADSLFTTTRAQLYNIFSKPSYPADTTVTGQWAVWAYDLLGDSIRSTSVYSIRYRIIRLTGIDDGDQEIPKNFVLYQNYPNPFNPTTKIKFGLPKDAHVTLEVFNIVGEKIGTLINSEMSEGYHEVSFDATNLQSGVYFYKLTAGNYTSIRKMLLIK